MKYQLFFLETQNIIISKSCYECSIEDGFNYLFEDTKYKWLIIAFNIQLLNLK